LVIFLVAANSAAAPADLADALILLLLLLLSRSFVKGISVLKSNIIRLKLCPCATPTCEGGASNPVPAISNQTAAAGGGCAEAATVDRGGESRDDNDGQSTTVVVNVKVVMQQQM